MSMQCCSGTPWCGHHSKSPIPSKSVSGPGVAFGTSWDCSMASSYNNHYAFIPPPQTVHYPSEEFTSSSMRTTRPPSESTTFAMSEHKTAWCASDTAIAGYQTQQWPPERQDGHEIGRPPVYMSEYQYANNSHQYPAYGLRDVSPSRTTDFSAMSASSEASPVISATSYEYMIKHEDEQNYTSPPPHLVSLDGSIKQEPYGTSMSTSNRTKEILVLSPKSRSRSRKRSTEVLYCSICMKKFDRRSNYKSHFETHEKNRERVTCKHPECTKTFGRTAEMTRHYKSSHEQANIYCSACNKGLTRHDILLRHQSDACPVLHSHKQSQKKRRSRDASFSKDLAGL